MDMTLSLAIGILACALSFVAGAMVDTAVNRICTRMDRERLIKQEEIIKTQGANIAALVGQIEELYKQREVTK